MNADSATGALASSEQSTFFVYKDIDKDAFALIGIMVRIQLINYMLCLLMIYCCDSSQHEGTNFVDSRDAVKIMEVKCTKEKYMVTGQVMWAIIIFHGFLSFIYMCVKQTSYGMRYAFAAKHIPPLLPAFDKAFVTQMSITNSSVSPTYSQAERALQASNYISFAKSSELSFILNACVSLVSHAYAV